jgi:phosphoribosyl 1,2-cyclic phosphodiesterase
MFRSLASSSDGNLGVVDDGRTRLILDAGLPLPKLQQALGYRLSDYAGVLITHEHMDHAAAARDLARRGMDVWCSAGTARARGIEGEAQRAVAGQRIQIGTLAVMPFSVVHDAAEPLGYLIASAMGGKLLYAVDTCYLPARFTGLTEIAVECNHSREALLQNEIDPALKQRIMANHMGLEVFLDFLRANDLAAVECIHLLHMSDSRGDAEGFKRAVQEETGKPVYVC